MATFDYDALRETALALLVQFGNALTLNRAPEGADNAGNYDPASGEFFNTVDQSVSGTGVLVGYRKNEINQDTVRATDRKLIFQGDALKIGDTYNGWRVHQLIEIDPAETGDPLVTIAQMRK